MRSIAVMMAALMSLQGTVYAQAPWHWDVTNVPDGTYLVTKTGNTFSFVPIRVSIVNPGTPPVNPPPDPPDDPSTLEEMSRKAAAEVNDPETAKKLALAYTTLVVAAESFDAFDTVAEFDEARSEATKRVLTTQALRDKWKPWSTTMQTQFTFMAQDGDLDTLDKYAAALTQVRDGLASVSEAIDLQTIIRTVMAVLELFSGDEITLEKILAVIDQVLKLFGD